MVERAALFVRLPADVMASVDEHVRVTGRTKQALVTDLVEAAFGSPSNPAGKQLQQQKLPADHAVLTLDEVAELLRVPAAQIIARIGDGGLPARRFGDEWRFSRDAVMRWLDAPDRSGPTSGSRKTGFSR